MTKERLINVSNEERLEIAKGINPSWGLLETTEQLQTAKKLLTKPFQIYKHNGNILLYDNLAEEFITDTASFMNMLIKSIIGELQ